MLFDFIVSHWREISVLGLMLVHFVITLITLCRKPNQVIDTIREEIDLMLPVFIRLAEDKIGPGLGANKKDLVISLVKDWFSNKGYKYTDFYSKYVSDMIEVILATPSKK